MDEEKEKQELILDTEFLEKDYKQFKFKKNTDKEIKILKERDGSKILNCGVCFSILNRVFPQNGDDGIKACICIVKGCKTSCHL